MGIKYNKVKFVLAFLVLIVMSCTNNQRLEKQIKEMIGRKITYPTQKLPNNRFLIVHYVDSVGCTSCKLRLQNWVMLQDRANELQADVGILFISHPYVYGEIANMLNENTRQYIKVIKDEKNNWKTINELPENELLNTFLVERQKGILVVGNPALNTHIEELILKKIIE